MTHSAIPPAFSPFLFWDQEPARLDPERHADYFIRRVFELGLVEDVAEALRYYDRERIIQALISADYLRENAIQLACVLFNLKKEDFKCSTSKQFHPLF